MAGGRDRVILVATADARPVPGMGTQAQALVVDSDAGAARSRQGVVLLMRAQLLHGAGVGGRAMASADHAECGSSGHAMQAHASTEVWTSHVVRLTRRRRVCHRPGQGGHLYRSVQSR